MPAPNSPGGGPVCVLKQTSGQSIANATDVKATWDTVLLDSSGKMFDASHNTRITILDAGWHMVGYSVGWAAPNNSRRSFYTVYKNSSVLPETGFVVGAVNNAGYSAVMGEAPLLLAAGDILEVDMYQDGTGAAAAMQNPCLFWAHRMPW